MHGASHGGVTLHQPKPNAEISMQGQSDGDAILRLREVCERGGFGMTTARDLIAKKRLPAVKIGRIVGVRRSDFDRFLAELPAANVAA